MTATLRSGIHLLCAAHSLQGVKYFRTEGINSLVLHVVVLTPQDSVAGGTSGGFASSLQHLHAQTNLAEGACRKRMASASEAAVVGEQLLRQPLSTSK